MAALVTTVAVMPAASIVLMITMTLMGGRLIFFVFMIRVIFHIGLVLKV